MQKDRRKISPESLERLRQTVIELFSEGLFHQVGLREIAKRAGVGLQTIYKYFGSKDDLILAAIERDMHYLTAILVDAGDKSQDLTAEEAFEVFGKLFFDFYFEKIHVAQIVFMNVPNRYWVIHPEFVQNKQLEIMAKIIIKGQKSGEIRDDVDASLLVQIIAGAIGRYMVNVLSSDAIPKSGKRASEETFKILWPMLKK